MNRKLSKTLVVVASLLALGASGLASAQRHERDFHGGPPPRGWVIDHRYHHDHYYPRIGFYAAALPAAALAIGFGRDRFWYDGGVWYRPWRGGYTVIAPPFGAVIPVLPADYVTLTYGGAPYYYANGAYYSAYSRGPGYVVVAPPAGIEDGAQYAGVPVVSPPPSPVVPAARPDPIIYPRNGQGPEQTEADRQACNRWATTQPSAMNSASVFSRAVEACMDGRGYTMK